MSVASAEIRRPVVAARQLCAVAAEMDVSVADVLAGTSVTQADLDDPEGDLSSSDEITMARNLLRLAPEPAGVGVAVGSRINLTNLGMFGFAAMASGTLRELISVGLRFFSLTTLHVSIQLSEGPADCEIAIDASHLPDDVRRFFVECDIAAIVATVPLFVHPVLSRHADEIRVDFAADEEYLRPLLDTVAIRHVEFGRERSVVRAPARDARRTTATGRPAHAGRLCRPVRADSPAATAPSRFVGPRALRTSFRARGNAGPGCRRSVPAPAPSHAAPSAGRRRHLVSRTHQ